MYHWTLYSSFTNLMRLLGIVGVCAALATEWVYLLPNRWHNVLIHCFNVLLLYQHWSLTKFVWLLGNVGSCTEVATEWV